MSRNTKATDQISFCWAKNQCKPRSYSETDRKCCAPYSHAKSSPMIDITHGMCPHTSWTKDDYSQNTPIKSTIYASISFVSVDLDFIKTQVLQETVDCTQMVYSLHFYRILQGLFKRPGHLFYVVLSTLLLKTIEARITVSP